MNSSAARYFPGVFARRNGNHKNGEISASCNGSESCTENAEVAEPEVSDEALVLRLQAKDITALGLLYRRYARVVYSVCDRIIRDPAEAEDLVHEVFLSLYRRCGSFDPTKGTARSWLVQLTYHKCFDWRDYLKARHGFQQGNGDGKSPVASSGLMEDRDPEEQTISNDQMKAAFASLSREQQLTVKLRLLGYSFHEIAQRLGCSQGNAKNHVYRGLQRLRRIVFDGNGPGLGLGTQERTKFQGKNAVQ